MAQPIFIVCSQSGCIDATTNLMSIFHILERIIVSGPGQPPPQGGRVSPFVTFRTSAAWARDPGDEGREFDYQFAVALPQQEEHVLTEGTFVFKGSRHRFFFDSMFPPVQSTGEIRVVVRVKPSDSDTPWSEQIYSIQAEMAASPVSSPSQANR